MSLPYISLFISFHWNFLFTRLTLISKKKKKKERHLRVAVKYSPSFNDLGFLIDFGVQFLTAMATALMWDFPRSEIHSKGAMSFCCCHFSVSKLCLTLCNPMDCSTGPPYPLPSPKVFPSSCPLNRWEHPDISFSVTLFSFTLQYFPISESFPKSQLFEIGGQI